MQEILMRPDAKSLLLRNRDSRTPERVLAHYLLEKGLRKRLMETPPDRRTSVYSEVYDELHRRLPDHPLACKPHWKRSNDIRRKIDDISQYLSPDSEILEIGCGDARLSFELAHKVRNVYGVDVVDALIDYDNAPSNFHFLRTSGIDISLPSRSVDFVISEQLMEHLHPDDAKLQLKEVLRVLTQGGRYWITTPNRVTGPHDVSKYFDYEATCFHLKEYDYSQLNSLLRQAGFARVRYYIGKSSHLVRFPTFALIGLENALSQVPCRTRAKFVRNKLATGLMGIHALASK